MKLLLLGLLIPVLSYGVVGSNTYKFQDASSTNIPTAYTTAGGTFHSSLNGKTHIEVINDTATDILVCFTEDAAADCAADDMIVPDGAAVTRDDVLVGAGVYVKSSGSAISSGNVAVTVW